jgi:hypothetical protein
MDLAFIDCYTPLPPAISIPLFIINYCYLL